MKKLFLFIILFSSAHLFSQRVGLIYNIDSMITSSVGKGIISEKLINIKPTEINVINVFENNLNIKELAILKPFKKDVYLKKEQLKDICLQNNLDVLILLQNPIVYKSGSPAQLALQSQTNFGITVISFAKKSVFAYSIMEMNIFSVKKDDFIKYHFSKRFDPAPIKRFDKKLIDDDLNLISDEHLNYFKPILSDIMKEYANAAYNAISDLNK
ncbi:hypothetical protein HZP94_10020 [Elizabethkingia anophelis]|nr:hypothetical protein [Elizabethkingia anophelis]MCT4062950.1 hypothetical protein [Elizabethkingia anophelis]MCT4109478.1 hypothetical protein [Elizabethkingia anophelis]